MAEYARETCLIYMIVSGDLQLFAEAVARNTLCDVRARCNVHIFCDLGRRMVSWVLHMRGYMLRTHHVGGCPISLSLTSWHSVLCT